MHSRHAIVMSHVGLANRTAPADGLDATTELVRFHGTGGNGRRGDEENAGRGFERGEHGTGDDGLDGRDGGIGIALVEVRRLKREESCVLTI